MKVDRSPKSVAGATDIVKIACGAFHNLCLNACASACPCLIHLCFFYNKPLSKHVRLWLYAAEGQQREVTCVAL
jgi:hypothetical protein